MSEPSYILAAVGVAAGIAMHAWVREHADLDAAW